MRPFTRIAAIVLGAFALGVVVVIGWAALVSEAADLSDRVRRARCTWVDPLVVAVSGQELSIAATPSTTLFTGDRWLSGEEVSGYRSEPSRFGFCLDAQPEAPMVVRAVTIALEAARAPAARTRLPLVSGPMLEIAEGSMFLPDAPPPVGRATDLVVYHRNPDFGWPRMVTQGVDRDGFRIGAVCRDGVGGGWLCDVSVLDTRAGLSYRFAHLPIDAVGFDARPIPAPFLGVAKGMRALGGLLKDDAVARR